MTVDQTSKMTDDSTEIRLCISNAHSLLPPQLITFPPRSCNALLQRQSAAARGGGNIARASRWQRLCLLRFQTVDREMHGSVIIELRIHRHSASLIRRHRGQ